LAGKHEGAIATSVKTVPLGPGGGAVNSTARNAKTSIIFLMEKYNLAL
jgi:hypothetical protein